MNNRLALKQMQAWNFLFFPVFLIIVIFILPTAWAFWMSLHDYSHSLYQPHWVGFQNYLTLWNNSFFVQSILTTLCFSVVTIPLMLTLPICLALLVEPIIPGMTVFRLIAYLPVILPLVAVSIAWKGLYAEDGLINQNINSWIGVTIPWLTDPQWALWAILVMIVWKGLAYYGMMILSQLLQQDLQLHEAARLDGANAFQRFWHLTLPYLMPVLGLVGTISMLGCFKAFTEFYVMTRGGPLHSTTTWLYWIYHRGFENLDLGLASAGGLLLMLTLGTVAFLQYKISVVGHSR